MRILRRSLSALLIGTFCLPAPAYALRPELDRSGLEEQLHPSYVYDPASVASGLLAKVAREYPTNPKKYSRFLDTKGILNLSLDFVGKLGLTFPSGTTLRRNDKLRNGIDSHLSRAFQDGDGAPSGKTAGAVRTLRAYKIQGIVLKKASPHTVRNPGYSAEALAPQLLQAVAARRLPAKPYPNPKQLLLSNRAAGILTGGRTVESYLGTQRGLSASLNRRLAQLMEDVPLTRVFNPFSHPTEYAVQQIKRHNITAVVIRKNSTEPKSPYDAPLLARQIVMRMAAELPSDPSLRRFVKDRRMNLSYGFTEKLGAMFPQRQAFTRSFSLLDKLNVALADLFENPPDHVVQLAIAILKQLGVDSVQIESFTYQDPRTEHRVLARQILESLPAALQKEPALLNGPVLALSFHTAGRKILKRARVVDHFSEREGLDKRTTRAMSKIFREAGSNGEVSENGSAEEAARALLDLGIKRVVIRKGEFRTAAGTEEPTRHSLYYDPKEVAIRLLDAFLALPTLKDEKYFDPETGKVSPTPSDVSRLLDGRPRAETLRTLHKSSGKRFFQEVNRYLIRRKSSSASLAWRLDELSRRGAVEIRIGPPRQVDLRPWPEKRVRRVVNRAKKTELSFNPTILEGPQADETSLGRQLKSLFGQIVRTNKFPQYGKSWPNFLLAHGIPLKEAYGESGPPKAKETFSVYVDLERDEKGLPIPDERKHIADLKIGRLDSLWKDPHVQQAKIVFLLGVRTQLSKKGGVLFAKMGKRHYTNIPRSTFRPKKPVKLAIEIAVADPYHAVQVARRMDTGKIVYPFKGQIRFYLDPPARDGQVPEDAFLFRAVNTLTKRFIKEIAKKKPGAVYATHVPTFLRSGPRTRAQFSVKPGVIRSTSIRYSKKRPALLTVRIDPDTGMPLEAWRMGGGPSVFPREDRPPEPVYQVFVDAPKDAQGLVLPGTQPDLEVSHPVWESVWSKISKPGAKTISVQGFPTHDLGKKIDRLTFFFEGEQYLTSISASSGELPLLQVDFRADDPDRRPQQARRMDKPRESVYPSPEQKRIWIDPKLEKGKVISGHLYKAVYKLDSATLKIALKKARRRVVLENLSTAAEHGRVSFWDPIRNKRRMTSLPYQPGVLVNVVMAKRVNGAWPISAVYDARGRDITDGDRRTLIQRDLVILRGRGRSRQPSVARAEAADRLFHWGALNARNEVTTGFLRDLLFDYHRDIFRDVAAETSFGLMNVAAEKYASEPDLFWKAVYVPLKEAEGMRPKQALAHIQAAKRSLTAAGLEETEPQRLSRVARQMQAQGWIESAGRFQERLIGRIEELAQRDHAAAGVEEIRRFDAEGFATQFPEQAKRVPAGAGRIAVVPEGTVFRLYRPETLASGVEEWAAAHRSELPGVEIRAEPVPARLFQVERLAVFLWDPMLGPLPYEPSVPVVQQWAGQPIPYRADGLFGLALWGPGATPTRLIAAWTFEKDGRQFLAIAA